MCSSTRGPAIMPSLVTWPTSSRLKPRRLASLISSAAEARTWATVPGAESRLSRYMVWMESMMTSSGAEAPGAQPHLLDGLLARDVNGARRPGEAAEGGRHLEHEGRFADAGIAADEKGRALDQPAAHDAVELGDAAPPA